MGLCSIFAMLDKKAVHGNNNLIVSFFEEKEKSEADVWKNHLTGIVQSLTLD